MRMLGTIEGQSAAEHFVAYLLTREISAQVEATPQKVDHWDIWIRDEDRIDLAKSEFLRFLTDPNNVIYGDAVKQAQQILREQRQQRQEAVKRIHRVQPQSGVIPSLSRLTIVLIVLSVIISLVTEFMDVQSGWGAMVLNQLSFLEIKPNMTIEEMYANPLASVKKGEVWRVVTPIFLHGSEIHLLFNMMMLVQLGRLIEWREGTFRYGMIILGMAVFSNLLQGCMPVAPMGLKWLGGSPTFGGMSGVIYGLFGYLWIKSTLRPDRLPQIAPTFVMIMIVWMLAGFAGAIGNVANLAHFGGLIAGMFLGWILQNSGAPKISRGN